MYGEVLGERGEVLGYDAGEGLEGGPGVGVSGCALAAERGQWSPWRERVGVENVLLESTQCIGELEKALARLF